MNPQSIEVALNNILVTSKGEVFSKIESISEKVVIQDTKTLAYCYILKLDANGNLRLADLVNYLMTKLLEYAIPKKELDLAYQYLYETKSPSRIIALNQKAKTLFTQLKNTGEGGELLLYILTTEVLQLPQLISKMSVKTSGQVHYQGADGIHVGFDKESQNLHLYWGEAKMYQELSAGISACIASLKDYLLDVQGNTSTQERDLSLITSNISANVNNEQLENSLVRYFDKDDDFSNHVVYKGICFIGFDTDKYPTKEDITQTTEIVKKKIEQELESWYKTLSNNISNELRLAQKEIHVFLMPFPSVQEFRDMFLTQINHAGRKTI